MQAAAPIFTMKAYQKKISLRYVDAADVSHRPEQRGGPIDTSSVNVVRPARTYHHERIV